MDSYYAPAVDVDAATAAPAGTGAVAGGGGWRLCFPRIYARGCVPRVNQSRVDEMSCEST